MSNPKPPAAPNLPTEPLPPAPGSAAARVAELRAALELTIGELADLAREAPADVYRVAGEVASMCEEPLAAAVAAVYEANGYSDTRAAGVLGVARSTLWAIFGRNPRLRALGDSIRKGKKRAGVKSGRPRRPDPSPTSAAPPAPSSLL